MEELLDGLIDIIQDALREFMCWIIEIWLDLSNYVVDLIMPDNIALNDGMGSLGSVLSTVNWFVPIGYGFTLLGTYFSIKATLIVIRWILKFVPTID